MPQHGGRRDNSKRRSDDARGGARRGAGRPIKTIHLDDTTARTFKILVGMRGLAYTPANVALVATELAEAEWRRIDAELTSNAESTAWEGEVL